ncbi:hypothetical protein TNCT_391451 [Trichonephila clavata]|uniref:Uncharacterized protein n=1 Tax=Trichonephila clavata TaxID=2740835 RepID=A0A8X6KSI3_TRICU|nr:hypothetical protein TNCT_391451 [Trichonephila clavata]
MDPISTRICFHIWTLRSKQATLVSQHCVERILGRDNVALLGSDQVGEHFTENQRSQNQCTNSLPWTATRERIPRIYRPVSLRGREVRGKHVRAVRQLYRKGIVQTPHECRSFLESIFEGTCPESRDGYVESVQEQVAEIAEWRREQQTKKKRPLETKEEVSRKVLLETHS